MKKNTKISNRAAFTIVELLTVMAVIAILMGLLVPALSLVQDYAKEVKQKGQFHSIEVAIGLFKNDFGMYPPSNDNAFDVPVPLNPDPANYGGAQKLAEALVGYDLLGFHPKADFRSDGLNDYDGDGILDDVYGPVAGITSSLGTYTETDQQNIQNRKGPYIELENANAFRMEDVYGAANVGTFDPRNFVLCDVYAQKRISGKKTGMPILYYRARTQYPTQDYILEPPELEGIEKDIFYYRDNEELLLLGSPDGTTAHPLADEGAGTGDWQDFEQMILNSQVTAIKRPYRAGSYILISAGPDGLYGTGDDICNFDKEQ